MAAFHSARSAKLGSIVAGHWMGVAGMQAFAMDSVATKLLAGAMPVVPFAAIKPNMGTAFWRTKEKQVSSLKSLGVARLHCQRGTEPFLLIGVAW